MSTALQRLASWFKSQVDGTWEQDWGITLQTIDNPGWMLEINLDGTPLYNVPFKHLKTRRGKDDWVECAIQDHGRAGGDEPGRIFAAAGGPGNLEELVSIFCDWAEQSTGTGRHPASSGKSGPSKPQPFKPSPSGPRQPAHQPGKHQPRRQGPNSSGPNSSGRRF